MQYKDYPLHYINLLNKTLLFIKENSALAKDEPNTINVDEIPKPLFLQLLRHLEKEGYIFFETRNKPNGDQTNPTYISIHGLAFLEKGGFVHQYNADKAKYNWNIAKTIAATANAIIIIVVAILAICVSNKSNQQERQLKVYEDSIQKLNQLIK